MKQLLLAVLILTATACGSKETVTLIPGPAGANGTNGTNGTNGADGAQGPQGPAGSGSAEGTTITVYNSSSCQQITGTSFYVKTDDIYTASNCSSPSKVAELTGADDTFWVNTNMLAVENSGGIKVITFN